MLETGRGNSGGSKETNGNRDLPLYPEPRLMRPSSLSGGKPLSHSVISTHGHDKQNTLDLWYVSQKSASLSSTESMVSDGSREEQKMLGKASSFDLEK